MNSKVITLFSVIVLVLFLTQSASAITASIGNSRMVLKAEVGEVVEKSILVKNVNNETVNISLAADGDLKDNVVIKEANFILKAGEEKKAYFTIQADEEGTTETRIHVKFTPEKGNIVGLAAVIILTAGEGGEIESGENVGENNNVIGLTGGLTGNDAKSPGIKINWMYVFLATPGILLVILIILMIIAKKKAIKQKKIVRKNE